MSARFLWFPLVSVTKRFVAVNMCLGRFSENPLITDTGIIRTLWRVPLVSVLTGFHCKEKQRIFQMEIKIVFFWSDCKQ